MRTHKILTFISLAIFGLNLSGQNVSFKATAPANTQTGNPFYLQYTLNAPVEGKNFKLPKIEGFNVLGQNTSESSSYSTTIINGRIKSEQSIILTWFITLQPKKEGTYTIPPASVAVNGKIYSSNSVTINVSKGSATNQNIAYQQTNTPNYDDGSDIAKNISSNLFLNVSTNKTSVYVGEPIYAYCKMFSAYDISMKDFDPSTFDNFWNKSLPMPQQIQAQRENINNRQFLTAVLDKRVIFPQKSGSLKISPYKAEFQLYDNWGFPGGTKKVVSNTKVINVKPLPDNKPASFTGAVGNFKITEDANLKTLSVDQTYTITLKIEGLGNFGLFDVPQLKLPTTFENLAPETKENTEATMDGMQGSQTVKYTFIPRVPGKFTIEPVEFSYFDYKAQKYIKIKTDTIYVTVTGDSSATVTNQPNVIQGATMLENDIRFIKQKTKLIQTNNFVIEKTYYILLYVLSIVAFLVLIFILRKNIQKHSNIRYMQLKRAGKVSKKRLTKAETLMNSNDLDNFYSEISTAIWGYLSDKFNIPLAELTRYNIVEKLKENNISEDLINNAISLLDTCETAKYAPSSANTDTKTIYQKTSELIDNFEKIGYTDTL